MKKKPYQTFLAIVMLQTLIILLICYRFNVNPWTFTIDSTLFFFNPLLLLIVTLIIRHNYLKNQM